MQIKM